MRTFNLLLMLCLLLTKTTAQSDSLKTKTDTIFYTNKYGLLDACPREKAEGFATPDQENPKLFIINYLQTGDLMVEYEIINKKNLDSNNVVSSIMPVKNGKYEEWYISGEKRVSANYSENKLNGDFKVFYKNGKLKRTENWKNGERKSGECYNDKGNKTTYCPYLEFAEFKGGIPALYAFIGKELKYPQIAQDNGIQGAVYVDFVVDKDGSVKDIEVIRSLNPDLDNEAIRVVKAMPKWNPAKFEGKPVAMTFTLPFRFSF